MLKNFEGGHDIYWQIIALLSREALAIEWVCVFVVGVEIVPLVAQHSAEQPIAATPIQTNCVWASASQSQQQAGASRHLPCPGNYSRICGGMNIAIALRKPKRLVGLEALTMLAAPILDHVFAENGSRKRVRGHSAAETAERLRYDGGCSAGHVVGPWLSRWLCHLRVINSLRGPAAYCLPLIIYV